MESSALILFARYPEAGKVKTRLAATVGAQAAAEFYRACAEHVFAETANVGAHTTRYLFYSEHEDAERMRQWAGPQFEYREQCGDDLGKRMKNAFESMFTAGMTNVIIIGTDAPDVSAVMIYDALIKLDSAALVIGPARDGGYYLLGMKQLYPELFEDVHWGAGQVLSETMNKAAAKGLSVITLTPCYDIDTLDDLHQWMRNTSSDHPLLPIAQKIAVPGKQVAE